MNQKIFDAVLKFLTDFFGKDDKETPVSLPAQIPAQNSVQIPAPISAQIPVQVVDWNDPASKVSKHFSVKEATYLNSWATYHKPTDDQKQAILTIAASIDKVCDILEQKLGKPVSINVHAWMRPDHAICPGTQWDGQDYNRYIYETQVWKDLTPAQKAEKRVPLSPHRTGHAVDFHVIGFEGPEGCAKIREMILPHLEELGLRMENLDGGWVHLDNLPVVNQRFFKP